MKLVGLLLALLASASCCAQSGKSFSKAMKSLRTFATRDSARILPAVDAWWQQRLQADQVPLLSKDSAVFLYRGNATSVWWAGDFNGWGSKPAPAKGVRIRNTDIWMVSFAFPPAARFDYKIILNERDWILDPVNPHQQYSGVGGGSPNSEIRMPGWKGDVCQQERPGVARGTVREYKISSKALGYEIAYSVYTPNEAANQHLSTLYVTDGNEYIDPRLGNLRTVLDNLISDKKIRPLRVVFVDARDPGDQRNNRRMSELSLNEAYVAFLAEELIPAVEHAPRIDRVDRGILGTSLGGLTAAYVSFRRPDLFGLAAIQSPAFWYKSEIFTLAEQSGQPTVRYFMSSGTYFDTAEASRRMKPILEARGHSVAYQETDEGHSWGNWRNLMDDLLVALYGTDHP